MPVLRLFFVVGEPSGDTLAASMIDGLKAAGYDLELTGMGGEKMLARGLVSVEPMESLTIMGILDALKAVPRLNRLADALIDHIMKTKPDAVITVDSKGFNIRFACRLRQKMKADYGQTGYRAPVIHTVAPTVWAWAGWRARKVAVSVDRLLCLYPFEVPFFTPYGLDTLSVGHPAADQKRYDYAEARAYLGVEDKTKLLVLLPGSRRREVTRLLPDMITAVGMLRDRVPELKVLLPMAPAVADTINALIETEKAITPVQQSDLPYVLAGGDFGLICSGTVSLEAAMNGLPGSVYYRMDALTDFIGRIIARLDRVVLPNVIAGAEIYPFALGRDFTVETMVETAFAGLSKGRDQKSAANTAVLMKELSTQDGFATAAAEAILTKIDR